MSLFEADAIILRSYPLAEADKIVVFLTEKFGLLRGVAKGAKRPKSKFGSSLEPFSQVRVRYFQKDDKELVSIQGIDIRHSFFDAASNPELLQGFSYFSELLIEFSPPLEANERLYRMACACIEAVVAKPEYLSSVVLYFELWLLRLGGYLPEWSSCSDCRKPFGSSDSATLQMNFHLLCTNCQRARSPYTIGAGERLIFEVAQTVSPSRFIDFTTESKENIKKVSEILKRIIIHITEREPVSPKVDITQPHRV